MFNENKIKISSMITNDFLENIVGNFFELMLNSGKTYGNSLFFNV
jgi:hypothetical protein